uniref:Phospholipase A2 n=1 Tax=Meloidogyne hapla TaxID=6305 RepID=A0A1I8AZ18_MELHA
MAKYNMKCNSEDQQNAQCSADKNNNCQQALCQCDREIVQCWEKIPVPKKEEECYSKVVDDAKLLHRVLAV